MEHVQVMQHPNDKKENAMSAVRQERVFLFTDNVLLCKGKQHYFSLDAKLVYVVKAGKLIGV